MTLQQAPDPGSASPDLPAGRTVFVKSYGCQMNVYDSQRMADALAADGYAEVDSLEQADLVVLNTCHIREKASEKVYAELGRVRVLREQRRAVGRDLGVAVAGCVAQAEGHEVLRRAPVVDVVVGPQAYHRLPALLRGARGLKPLDPARVDTEFPVEPKFAGLPSPTAAAVRARGPVAYVTAQEGCDKFCAFCVVPYTRGAEVSRPVAEVVEEVARLAEAGVREVALVGQNVNAYHGEGPDGRPVTLGALLHRLAAVPGVERLRYTTSHPADMDDALIEAHRDLDALMPFLHLPVQSGSDRVLAAMNRRHRAADYLAVIERVRRARPDIALSSDFIVGFPGETDAEFRDTLALVEAVGYASAYTFRYSPRPGTPASTREGAVPDAVAAERLGRLQALTDAQQRAFNAGTVGRTLSVLLERPGRAPGQLLGRSPYLQTVAVEAPREWLGRLVPVRVTGTGSFALRGSVQPDTPTLEDHPLPDQAA